VHRARAATCSYARKVSHSIIYPPRHHSGLTDWLTLVDRNALYTFGSLARGRLGQPGFYPPTPQNDGEEPTVSLLSQATHVPLPPILGNVTQIAVGFEHVLLLTGESSSTQTPA